MARASNAAGTAIPYFSACRGADATSIVASSLGDVRFSIESVNPHDPLPVFQLVGPVTNQLNSPPPALYQSFRYFFTRSRMRGSSWAACLAATLFDPNVSGPPS